MHAGIEAQSAIAVAPVLSFAEMPAALLARIVIVLAAGLTFAHVNAIVTLVVPGPCAVPWQGAPPVDVVVVAGKPHVPPSQIELVASKVNVIVTPQTVQNTFSGIGTRFLQHTVFGSVAPSVIVTVPPHDSVLVELWVG